jgi:uncharacterized protein (TIGR03435 family)
MKHLVRKSGFQLGISLAVAAGILFAGPGSVFAQAANSSATDRVVGSDGKPLTFDVISVREDKSVPTPEHPPQYGPTPDGYRLKGLPMILAILAAYIPSQGGDSVVFKLNQIAGIPTWLSQTRYDIDAKVSEADLFKWRDPAQQPAMLRAMLQAMLADRFKLAVRRETKVVPLYEMTVGRTGPKFKLSEATALADIRMKHPDAFTLVGGTIAATGPSPGQQRLFGVSMPALSSFLSNMAGRPIHDMTGLTGKYDITYEVELPQPAQEGAGLSESPDFSNSQIFFVVEDQLGLKLKPDKGPVEFLVIDHVERPSEN